MGDAIGLAIRQFEDDYENASANRIGKERQISSDAASSAASVSSGLRAATAEAQACEPQHGSISLAAAKAGRKFQRERRSLMPPLSIVAQSVEKFRRVPPAG